MKTSLVATVVIGALVVGSRARADDVTAHVHVSPTTTRALACQIHPVTTDDGRVHAFDVSVNGERCAPAASNGAISLQVQLGASAIDLDATASSDDVSPADLGAMLRYLGNELGARTPDPPPPEPAPDAHPLKAMVGVGLTIGMLDWVVSIGAVIKSTTYDSYGGYGGSRLSLHSYSGWLLLPYIGSTIAIFDNIGKPTMNGEMAYYGVTTAINAGALALAIVGATYRAPHAKSVSFVPTADAHGATMAIAGTF